MTVTTGEHAMALSNAEKQRRYRERMKEIQKGPEARKKAIKPTEDELAPFLQSSFGEFVAARSSNILFNETLHWCGVELNVDLENDHPDFERAADWREWSGIEPTSLNVATGLVGAFIDAAKELSMLINEFKLQEIDEAMKTASPADKVRLEYMRKPLTKRTSHFFPVIEVKES
jgi:hypothetical protein